MSAPGGGNAFNRTAFEAWLDALPESWEKIEDRRNDKNDEEEFHRRRGRSKVEHKGEWPKAKE
jgi:hypothetical protein